MSLFSYFRREKIELNSYFGLENIFIHIDTAIGSTACHWSRMRTFGDRTLPRVPLLVGTDTEETFSTTDFERFRLSSFPLGEY